jgi:hypothetical protein
MRPANSIDPIRQTLQLIGRMACNARAALPLLCPAPTRHQRILLTQCMATLLVIARVANTSVLAIDAGIRLIPIFDLADFGEPLDRPTQPPRRRRKIRRPGKYHLLGLGNE